MNLISLPKFFGILAGTSAALVACSVTAVRADPPTPAPSFASVDIQAVIAGSKLSTTLNSDFAAYQKRETVNFGLVTDGAAVFLSDAEVTELDGLYDKEKQTEADKKRIADLVGFAESRQSQLKTLENTAKPTDDQRKTFNDLTGMRDHGVSRKRVVAQDYDRRLDAKHQELDVQALKDARGAIAEVAKAKAITIVFDSRYAVYAANDITPDVIKQLSK